MDRKLKLIKVIGIVLMILIVIVAIILIIFYKKAEVGTSGENLEVTTFETKDTYVSIENIDKLKNKNKYYTVKMLVERYFNYIKDSSDEELNEELRMLNTTALISVLDEKYKEEFDINNDNVLENYNDINQDEVMEIDDIYFVEENASSNIFLVYGTMLIQQKEFKLMVRTDSLKMLFSIYPEEYMEKYDYSYENNKEDFENLFVDALEVNEYNKFEYNTVSSERMAVIYFNDFKDKLLGNVEKAYESLDEEYREKRFGSLENFKKYVDDNRSDLSKLEISSYLSENKNGDTIYVCKDQFDGVYIFNEIAVEEYTVELDDYTLDYDDDEFLEEYDKSSDKYKVANNINRWVKMINSRDYEAAYSVLDETFRETEFGSLEKFEEYMRRAFSEHYEVEYEEFTEETNKIYTQKIILNEVSSQDDDQEKDKIEKTIIMKLENDTDFVMSFNITKADVVDN